jgi:hypothetical protein
MEISAPEALVQRIYTLPNPDFGAFIEPERRPQFYTDRIHTRAKRMERCYAEKFGMDFLDIDFIVPGNDYDIAELSITLLQSQRRTALVRVNFNRSAGIVDPIELFYHLKLTRSGWRINDVSYGNETLAQALWANC